MVECVEEVYIPPPQYADMFALIELDEIAGIVWVQAIPPPLRPAELPVMQLYWITGPELGPQYIPPPSDAVFSVMVLLVIRLRDRPVSAIPPPL